MFPLPCITVDTREDKGRKCLHAFSREVCSSAPSPQAALAPRWLCWRGVKSALQAKRRCGNWDPKEWTCHAHNQCTVKLWAKQIMLLVCSSAVRSTSGSRIDEEEVEKMHWEATSVIWSWARKVLCKGNIICLLGLLKENLDTNHDFTWSWSLTAEASSTRAGTVTFCRQKLMQENNSDWMCEKNC